VAEEEAPTGFWDFASKQTERLNIEDIPEWLRRPSMDVEEPEQALPRSSDEAELPPAVPEAATEETGEPAELSADLPAWLAGLDREESQVIGPAPSTGQSDELPAWLQSEMEPEPEVKEPAKSSDWRPARSQPMEAAQPAVEAEAPAEESAMPAAARPEPAPVVEKTQAPVPAPSRPKPASVAKPSTLSITDAQMQLARGNIAGSLDIYGKLIRKGKFLQDIIRDLRDALYRYPVEVPLWQSLGDAYMRANRLQEALDAYTKAEELLR
jgi:hypothetical protein